jgi:cellulose synthase/poly-beta-1,6-N-acetylglucosamine synthase-like glycosyltransferase
MMASLLLTAYFSAFAVLALFSLHRIWLLRSVKHSGPAGDLAMNSAAQLPFVTIQLPIYNERFVAERLLRAVFDIEYPRDRLEIQVLDDSSDDTSERIAAAVAAHRPAGLKVIHMRRTARVGYKAGALAQAAVSARGEFTLILDADFVPPANLLHRLLPPMHDPRVAMVQARWTHTNRAANRLTEAQALLLDAHFLIETEARYRSDVFFNFHGTAGLWRSQAIHDAGGWQADTLTEDLDLSYRAQMKGWRFVFLRNVVVPAELPETLPAFKQQQARWAEGTIATARKHLVSLVRGAWPLRVKLEATLHLLAHSIYPATLLVALLALPAMWVRRDMESPIWLFADVLLAVAVIVPTRLFYRRAARMAGTRIPGVRDFPYLMLTGIALAVSNSRAVAAGLIGRRTQFLRTPKFAAAAKRARTTYDIRGARSLRLVEGSVAAYLVVGVFVAGASGMAVAVPMLSFLALAFGLASARG